MCLIPKRPGNTIKDVVEVSDKDIYTWKHLISNFSHDRTPYRNIVITEPWLETDSFEDVARWGGLEIGKGIHSYLRKKTFSEGSSSFFVRATIPAGTPFIRGVHGDIVSLCLILGRF